MAGEEQFKPSEQMLKSNFNPDGTHQESIETLKFIAKWHDTPFPFSKSEHWGRFGILGVLGHMVLQTLPNTHILEIGTGESSIYLTELARRMNRKFYGCDFAQGKIYNPSTVSGYLHEDRILVRQGNIPLEYKNYQATMFIGTSDAFFKELEFPSIGLAFIDGEHKFEQVKKDFDNTFNLLSDDGYIFLHDTYPPEESYVLNEYCADAYKMRQELEKRDDVDCFTFNKMVACNVGITMARKRKKNREYYNE